MHTIRILGTGLLALLAAPALAVSTPVAGPGSYGVGPTDEVTEPELAGVVLAERSQAFSIAGAAGGAVSGTIEERVVRSDATGFLHFYHAVTLTDISGFEPGSYLEWLEFDAATTGTPLSVGRRTDAPGEATSSIYDLSVSGESRFDFNLIDLDPANIGFQTQWHFWTSEATNYALTGQAQLSGFEFIGFDAEGISTPWLATYAPADAAIPEPGTWVMLILGFGLVGMQRRMLAA